MTKLARTVGVAVFLLAGCASPGVTPDSAQHVAMPPRQSNAPLPRSDIPPPAPLNLDLGAPRASAKPETYSVVVHNVDVKELLFALARDARTNLDVHPGLNGLVTLNALEQTLPQLLSRISRQVDMRFELDGKNLSVVPDTPILRHYKIDYVNLARDTDSSIAVASQIGGGSSQNRAVMTVGGSGSSARIVNVSKNRFWESLTQNVKDILRETDRIISVPPADAASAPAAPSTVTREAASVITHMETGVLSVRATGRQHERVQEFLDRIMSSARRQVLIEATVVEVELSQGFQQGIDWRALNVFDSGLRIVQQAVGGITAPPSSLIELGYDSSGGNFSGAVKLLESFGTVKVLSSPKLSVLNNQTAVMKVVDDNIYFTYEINETDASTTGPGKTKITSTLHSVPVGLVLMVTPLVGDDDSVTLNIRPSLSRVIGQKVDPSLQLMSNAPGITNTIPIIRAREFDSVMRIGNGNIAIMGGLMEDAITNTDHAVPGLSALPVLGSLFQNRDDSKRKTELVIFVRPSILKPDSPGERQAALDALLPGSDFFTSYPGPSSILKPGSPR